MIRVDITEFYDKEYELIWPSVVLNSHEITVKEYSAFLKQFDCRYHVRHSHVVEFFFEEMQAAIMFKMLFG